MAIKTYLKINETYIKDMLHLSLLQLAQVRSLVQQNLEKKEWKA